MPITTFTSAVAFVWPAPPAPVPAPAPAPTHARLAAEARRLVRAFRRVSDAAPAEWVLNVSPRDNRWLDGDTLPPCGPISRWWYFSSGDHRRYPYSLWGTTAADVPGLPYLARVLYHCRRVAKALDPTDPTAAVFGQLVGRLLAERWAAGPLLPLGAARRVAVAYPTELLARLGEWADREPRRVGRKPDPVRPRIVARLGELKAAGLTWKDQARVIESEFRRRLKAASLRKMWERETKSGTE